MNKSGTGTTIRVLYIDDYQLDRELVREALAEDTDIHLTECASQQEFERLLQVGVYDLVLSDFNILGYDGLKVIEAVQATRPNLPIVIVTGTGSEEIAVNAMKLGAADYVIKSHQHIRRLPITIRTVLAQQRLRREREHALAELDQFFELSRDMLCVLDGEGRFRRVNPAAQSILGFAPQDLIQATAPELALGEDKWLLREQLQRVGRRKGAARFTVQCSAKTGLPRWLEWNVIRSSEKQRFFAVVRDITQRKQDEDKQRERAVAQAKFSTLSPRELEVMRMVVDGLANKNIARRLNLSEKTIERHRSNGMKKLQVHTVPDLVRLSLLADI